ncbi:hypothetical protein [Halobacterium jilantaiense]|uniref:Uncharacterized protein n=1 Tax=Halobacterium jilantaiense TaxID=355548 RepID=A0A1I0NQT2_9EURY|nr:hypothetical protein [Halobacterium jilantaiense]SEW03921.1 hypothetical protein SAMN04487945_1077 [Halobacterium jilantaiense]
MSEDVDPQALQQDLDRIKDAMGIAERYESAPEQWLLFSVLVAAGSAISQALLFERAAGFWFPVVWFGLFGAGSVALSRRYDYAFGPGHSEPNVGFQILVVYLGSFAALFAVDPFLPELGYLTENALTLGLVAVMLGLGYLVAGETLKAYRIRARDRYVLHGGGVLLVVLGVAIPNVDVLHTWGYAAFGASYVVYAAASYLVLTRT